MIGGIRVTGVYGASSGLGETWLFSPPVIEKLSVVGGAKSLRLTSVVKTARNSNLVRVTLRDT